MNRIKKKGNSFTQTDRQTVETGLVGVCVCLAKLSFVFLKQFLGLLHWWSRGWVPLFTAWD